MFFALYIDCVVPVKIHTPPGISIPTGAIHTPPPPPRSPSPGISVIFQLGWYPLERLFAAKMLLHYIIDTCFETSVTVK